MGMDKLKILTVCAGFGAVIGIVILQCMEVAYWWTTPRGSITYAMQFEFFINNIHVLWWSIIIGLIIGTILLIPSL